MISEDYIFGIRSLIESIESGQEINRILIQKGIDGSLYKELRQALMGKDYPLQYVPIEKLNKITRKNHQGIIAFVSPVTYYNLEDIIPSIYEQGKIPKILILDRITDVRNFGAIARTAECNGIDCIVIPKKGGATIGSDSMKTSAGALSRIPVCRYQHLKDAVNFARESGLTVISCTEKTDQVLVKTDFNRPCAIIMGSEESGISKELLQKSDEKVSIPMFGAISSYNVSVAAGIIMYEMMRQRSQVE